MLMKYFTNPDGKHILWKGGIIMGGNPFADICLIISEQIFVGHGLTVHSNVPIH